VTVGEENLKSLDGFRARPTRFTSIAAIWGL
jgi:hypothetical protein